MLRSVPRSAVGLSAQALDAATLQWRVGVHPRLELTRTPIAGVGALLPFTWPLARQLLPELGPRWPLLYGAVLLPESFAATTPFLLVGRPRCSTPLLGWRRFRLLLGALVVLSRLLGAGAPVWRDFPLLRPAVRLPVVATGPSRGPWFASPPIALTSEPSSVVTTPSFALKALRSGRQLWLLPVLLTAALRSPRAPVPAWTTTSWSPRRGPTF